MKTKILTLALTVLFFSAAHSQGFHLGFKGGANINKLTGKSFKDEFSFGYHLGGFANIGLGGKLSVQPEVLFNQINQDTSSNFRAIYGNLLTTNPSNVKLNYLSIPILLSFKPSNILSLQAGPQFGVILDQNKNMLQNGKEAFKNDLSLLGGVELKLLSFRVYGRYALGLNNLNDIDDKDKWKSQSIQIGIGLTIL